VAVIKKSSGSNSGQVKSGRTILYAAGFVNCASRQAAALKALKKS
jgi:hypothetical protein